MQWVLCQQRPAGEAPWATLCPPGSFPDWVGVKNYIFWKFLGKYEVSTNEQGLNTANGKEGQIRSKSHYENFEI